MTAPELLADLTAHGVRLAARDGRLAYDAPAGMMTPERLGLLRACKPELLVLLGGTPEPEPPTDERPESPWPPESDGYADQEWRRFIAVARPWPDGRGWYDPREHERFRRLMERPTARPGTAQAPALEETAVERAARCRAAWGREGYPAGVCQTAYSVVD